MPANTWLFSQQALQEYILCCCQEPNGGLKDKPGKPRDYYHSCYDLSGLSIAQNALSTELVIGCEDNKVVSLYRQYVLNSFNILFLNLGSNSSVIQRTTRFCKIC